MPGWFLGITDRPYITEAEKPQEQRRRVYRVQNGFTLNDKQYKRGFTIKLLPNDPRVEEHMNAGYLVSPVI